MSVDCQTITTTAPPPPPCSPNWVCEEPKNGYERDGCGVRRPNASCNAPTPANITATAMALTPSGNVPYTAGMTVTARVTWTNIGGSTGSFVPSVLANGTTIYGNSYSAGVAQPLMPGRTFTDTYTVTVVSAGVISFCPNPN